MARIRWLRFDKKGDVITLTGYGQAARGRKYRIGQVVLGRGVSPKSALPEESLSQLGMRRQQERLPLS